MKISLERGILCDTWLTALLCPMSDMLTPLHVCLAEQTTRLNKNPNLNKLQAGYLFPEVGPPPRGLCCHGAQ
jgi:hypothetical protein